MRWLGGAAVLLATLAIARSRAGLVCALAVCVLAIVLRVLPALGLLTRRSLAFMLIVLVALVVLAIASWGTIDQLIVQPFNHAWRPSADESNAQRWQSVVLGFQAWLQHPVFGNGLGTFLLDRQMAGLPVVVIHSVPVWFMAEMGLVGLAGFGERLPQGGGLRAFFRAGDAVDYHEGVVAPARD